MKKLFSLLMLFHIFSLTLKAEFIVKSYQELKNQQVIRQNYEESCGAASLATLINLIDEQNLSELEILKLMSKEELHTDMVSFANLEDVAKKLNFKSNSFRLNKEIFDELVDIPLLVKIEDDPRFPHFAIIINYKGSYIQILDPSYGEYISSKNAFFSLWDKDNQGGYALVLMPKKSLNNFTLHLPKKLDFERRVFGKF